MITPTIFRLIIAGCALLALAGCRATPDSSAAPTPQAAVPVLIHQSGQPEMIDLNLATVPGAKFSDVHEVELPGILETNGQVTFDDRRVSTIVSRVQGRIEQTRVSLWDNVRRGEPIVSLYSPDFMTAEAELLQ
ncbi:MAG: efflux RND transporter periplasmic adaptor subunit, partial [Candidatus Binataceae bacterium]